MKLATVYRRAAEALLETVPDLIYPHGPSTYCCDTIASVCGSQQELLDHAMVLFGEYFLPEGADPDEPWWSSTWDGYTGDQEARRLALLFMAEIAKDLP